MSKILPVLLFLLLAIAVLGMLFVRGSAVSSPTAASVGFEDVVYMARGSEMDATLGGLRGRVVNEDGQPVPGMEIHIIQNPMAVSLDRGIFLGATSDPDGTTDTEGRFEYSGLKPGNYQVIAMDSQYRSGVISAFVTVRAGQTSEGLELELKPINPDRILAGTVVDSSGTPVPRASVSVRYDTLLRGGSATRSTDQQGYFFMMLPADVPVEITAEKDGLGKASMESQAGEHHLELKLTQQTTGQ